MDGIAKFFLGTGGLVLAALIAGMAIGGWGAGIWNNAGMAREFRDVATQSSKALVILTQNAGRREMNYIRTQGVEREQCVATIEGFRDITLKSAEARAAAMQRGEQLQVQLRTQNARYADLLKSYEGADAKAKSWMDTDLPDDVKRMRWREDCGPDLFSAAGYPIPPGDKCAVAKPPG